MRDSEKKWQEILARHPEANFLQSPAYARTNEILGDKVLTSDFDGDGWGIMIVRDARRGRYLEVPCGPLANWNDAAAVDRVIEKIRELARQEKCVFVRMRPQLIKTKEHLALLEDAGMRESPMHLAAEHTVMIDLNLSEDELMAKMRRQTRYEVRRARKLGITVSVDNSKSIFEEFCQVQKQTAERQGFVPPSLKTLLAEREAFKADAQIYKACTNEGEAIAYGLIIKGGLEVDYYEAASTELNRKLPGAYALLWKAILDAKSAGYQRFNLWGIAPAGKPHHRYAGVTTFKTGFPGEIVEYVPAHDLVISRFKYLKNLIVESARRRRRHLC